jgi:hypothetical protein
VQLALASGLEYSKPDFKAADLVGLGQLVIGLDRSGLLDLSFELPLLSLKCWMRI